MVKRASKRNTFDYNKDRKKQKKKLKKKERPTIGCAQIRKAWDDRKSAKQNMQEMGLSYGTKGVLPINKKIFSEPVDEAQAVVVKPYVIKEMETAASLRGKNTRTCSNDLTEFVQYMIREHNEDYKAMAKDEKNYYQHTPKQIKRKVELYKRCHSQDYAAFVASLQAEKTS